MNASAPEPAKSKPAIRIIWYALVPTMRIRMNAANGLKDLIVNPIDLPARARERASMTPMDEMRRLLPHPWNRFPSVTLTITNATHATLTYDAGANHDPDGDGNGTGIVVVKPQ